jgi:transposase-like protein
MAQTLVEVGDFCPNATGEDYGKLPSARQHNLLKFGKTPQGRQRRRCQTCGQTFVDPQGTLFYRRRTPMPAILEVLALLAQGSRVSSLAEVKHHKEETVVKWLQEAATHAEAVLLADYQVTRGQLDGLWSYVGHKGGKKLSRNWRNRAVLALYHAKALASYMMAQILHFDSN